MEKAILFAVLASFCTATASVCQRIGARNSETAGFDIWLVFRLARRPTTPTVRPAVKWMIDAMTGAALRTQAGRDPHDRGLSGLKGRT